ncbi:MAG: phosphoribosyltransferase [Lachnospiraceae bacterium]|nr:phosphoribosyltransferase [Lachnospiraceae bacterium]
MNYRSIEQMNQLIRKKLYLIPNDIDVVIGIPRSGMLPASIISLYLNKPLISIEEVGKSSFCNFTTRLNFKKEFNFRKGLIVDDSCNSGASMDKAKNYLKNIVEIDFLYCAIFATETSKQFLNIYFEIIEQPRLFEWNIMNHDILKRSCLDMDGVLCWDPTEEQNDDGEKYIEFIYTAKPKFLPTNKIGTIVTSRLEKYRRETEIWLEKNSVHYDNLFMMDLPDMKTRQRLGNHAEFKAEIYGKSSAVLFIESNVYQAKKIFNITKKPVYSVENSTFFGMNL